jgi:hypothetical protein
MRREAIHVDGLGHTNRPIPDTARVDNILYSGGIHGKVRETGEWPEDLDSQVTRCAPGAHWPAEATNRRGHAASLIHSGCRLRLPA